MSSGQKSSKSRVAIQVVLSLCHCLQSVLHTSDLVPKQRLEQRCKGMGGQPELRHVLGAAGSGVSQPRVCRLRPALEQVCPCVSQRLMAKSPCSCWNTAAVLARVLSAPASLSVPAVSVTGAAPAETAVSVWKHGTPDLTAGEVCV